MKAWVFGFFQRCFIPSFSIGGNFGGPALERNLSLSSICTLLWLFALLGSSLFSIIRSPATLIKDACLINLGALELLEPEIRYEPMYPHILQRPTGRFRLILSGLLTPPPYWNVWTDHLWLEVLVMLIWCTVWLLCHQIWAACFQHQTASGKGQGDPIYAPNMSSCSLTRTFVASLKLHWLLSCLPSSKIPKQY